MTETHHWQNIWQREKPWNNGQPEPTQGQTSDPYGPNYIGPTNLGKAGVDHYGNAAMLGLTYAAVRRPGIALEVLGFDPTSFNDQSLYQIDARRLMQGFGGKIKGAQNVLDTVGTVIKSELSPKVALAGADGSIMQVTTDASRGILSPTPKSGKTQFGIGPQTLPIPLEEKVIQVKEVLPRYRRQLIKKGYTHVEKSPDGTLKGGPRGKFGGQWFNLKRNERNAKGFRTLKVKSLANRAKEAAKRTSREKPWLTKKNEIKTILTKNGHADKADKLLNLIKKQYNAKKKLIVNDGLTIGHHKALENGGLDVAENIGGEIGKSTPTQAGNYARGFRNDLPDEVLQQKGAFTGTLEEFVLMKLPEVLK